MPAPFLDDEALRPLLDALKRLRADWPGGGWSWDGRLSCAASTFSIDLAKRARAAASVAMPVDWTDGTVAGAPAAVRDAVKRAGGVRPGQLVLSAEPVASVTTYGLWWPWDNGKTISLRVGLVGGPAALTARLRATFGVQE